MSTMAPPQSRSLDQRMEALARANEIRLARAKAKRLLRLGAVDPVELLRDPPVYLATMKVEDFLRALPKIGRIKARQMLFSLRISLSKTIAGMSDRQRDELIERLAGR